jgi:peptidyl-prolyl cis-trans isomerase A (cyclophilin A)
MALLAAPALAQSPLANPAALNEQAPAAYKVKFDTSKGPFVVEVTRAWAPKGADRFYNLVKNGFYDNVRFFRVISGFMVQFGINGDPGVMARWRTAQIGDDPVTQSNKRGTITFAMAGPNTRTSQLFLTFAPPQSRWHGLRAVRPHRVRDERRRCAQCRIWRGCAARSRSGPEPPAE